MYRSSFAFFFKTTPGFHVIIIPSNLVKHGKKQGIPPCYIHGIHRGDPHAFTSFNKGGYPSSIQYVIMVPPLHYYLVISCRFIVSAICITLDASGIAMLVLCPYISLKRSNELERALPKKYPICLIPSSLFIRFMQCAV